jgi:hypothetical protein
MCSAPSPSWVTARRTYDRVSPGRASPAQSYSSQAYSCSPISGENSSRKLRSTPRANSNWGGEGAEAHGDRGACISGIHVCGHGTLSLQDTLVAACSNAGLVVSEKGSAVVTSSTLERPLISNVFFFF